jgi:hypothetical protein
MKTLCDREKLVRKLAQARRLALEPKAFPREPKLCGGGRAFRNFRYRMGMDQTMSHWPL